MQLCMTNGKDRSFGNYDALARMNFLYQASHLLLSIHAEGRPQGTENFHDLDSRTGTSALELSLFYSRTMKNVAKKSVVRM